jgi:hypothetical protein
MEKKVVLKAYEIVPAETKMLELVLPEMLLKSLSGYNTVNSRYLRHSDLDTLDEGDFIGDYKGDKKVLFGTMLRIKRGEANSVLLQQLDSPKIRLEDIAKQSEENVAGIIKDYGYFCMNKKYAVLTAGHISRKAIQTYFNWLLNLPESGPPICSLKPMIESYSETPISDIRSISISEAYFSQKPEYKTLSKSINIFKNELLHELLNDTRSLKDIAFEDILYAEVKLRIKSKGKNKTEQNKDLLSVLLKSVDSEDVVIKTKSGNSIKGGMFELKTKVSIEATETGFLHESQLETEMRKFLNGLDHYDSHS